MEATRRRRQNNYHKIKMLECLFQSSRLSITSFRHPGILSGGRGGRSCITNIILDSNLDPGNTPAHATRTATRHSRGRSSRHGQRDRAAKHLPGRCGSRGPCRATHRAGARHGERGLRLEPAAEPLHLLLRSSAPGLPSRAIARYGGRRPVGVDAAAADRIRGRLQPAQRAPVPEPVQVDPGGGGTLPARVGALHSPQPG